MILYAWQKSRRFTAAPAMWHGHAWTVAMLKQNSSALRSNTSIKVRLATLCFNTLLAMYYAGRDSDLRLDQYSTYSTILHPLYAACEGNPKKVKALAITLQGFPPAGRHGILGKLGQSANVIQYALIAPRKLVGLPAYHPRSNRMFRSSSPIVSVATARLVGSEIGREGRR